MAVITRLGAVSSGLAGIVSSFQGGDRENFLATSRVQKLMVLREAFTRAWSQPRNWAAGALSLIHISPEL